MYISLRFILAMSWTSLKIRFKNYFSEVVDGPFKIESKKIMISYIYVYIFYCLFKIEKAIRNVVLNEE